MHTFFYHSDNIWDVIVIKKMVICIPTYHHSKELKMVLESEFDSLCSYGIDLFVYDSSEDDETKAVVQEYAAKGPAIVHYIKIDPSMHSGEKVFKIYMDMEHSEYDYVWMIHDHTVIRKAAFLCVTKLLEEGADLIYMDRGMRPVRIDKVVNQACLAADAWYFSWFGDTILNVHTFLNGIDWPYYCARYLTPQIRNFGHTGLFLERSAELVDFMAYRVSGYPELFRPLNIKRNWYPETIQILGGSWVSITDKLPEIYDKSTVLGCVRQHPLLTTFMLIRQKRDGYLNEEIYSQYGQGIARLIPDRASEFALISLEPYSSVIAWYRDRLNSEFSKLGMESKELLIYGAGYYGKIFAETLHDCGMDFEGFVVTDGKDNPETIMGRPVYRAKDYLADKNALICIAISPEIIQHIQKYIDGLKTEKNNLEYISVFEL